MKNQLEEAKRIEEILKNQLEEKEQTILTLEMEVVGLKTKGEKDDAFVKFKDSSVRAEILRRPKVEKNIFLFF